VGGACSNGVRLRQVFGFLMRKGRALGGKVATH
jgi:hypothetical protein